MIEKPEIGQKVIGYLKEYEVFDKKMSIIAVGKIKDFSEESEESSYFPDVLVEMDYYFSSNNISGNIFKLIFPRKNLFVFDDKLANDIGKIYLEKVSPIENVISREKMLMNQIIETFENELKSRKNLIEIIFNKDILSILTKESEKK